MKEKKGFLEALDAEIAQRGKAEVIRQLMTRFLSSEIIYLLREHTRPLVPLSDAEHAAMVGILDKGRGHLDHVDPQFLHGLFANVGIERRASALDRAALDRRIDVLGELYRFLWRPTPRNSKAPALGDSNSPCCHFVEACLLYLGDDPPPTRRKIRERLYKHTFGRT